MTDVTRIPVAFFIEGDDLRAEFQEHARWPTHVLTIPMVGDWVRSGCGRGLKVVSVMHTTGYKKSPGAGIVVTLGRRPCPTCNHIEK